MQLLAVPPSGRVVVMMVRTTQAKSEGRGAAMGLGVGVDVCMVWNRRAILPTSAGQEVTVSGFA
jgi:hypothetical protein